MCVCFRFISYFVSWSCQNLLSSYADKTSSPSTSKHRNLKFLLLVISLINFTFFLSYQYSIANGVLLSTSDKKNPTIKKSC